MLTELSDQRVISISGRLGSLSEINLSVKIVQKIDHNNNFQIILDKTLSSYPKTNRKSSTGCTVSYFIKETFIYH